MRIIKGFIKALLRWIWVFNGFIGMRSSIDRSESLTVVIPSYSRARAENLAPLARSILKCKFVEKLIVSNHNPEIKLQDWIKLNDIRLILIDQPVRRGCGYGWKVAYDSNAEYVIIIDDDVSIFPGQLAKLFSRLVLYPAVPHGLAGMWDGNYYQSREIEVERLYQIYAVTRKHLEKFIELVGILVNSNFVSEETIEFWGDDLVISRTGIGKPRIHQAGFILRHSSANEPGVATYLEPEFSKERDEVWAALNAVLKFSKEY